MEQNQTESQGIYNEAVEGSQFQEQPQQDQPQQQQGIENSGSLGQFQTNQETDQIEQMKEHISRMEEESERLNQMQQQIMQMDDAMEITDNGDAPMDGVEEDAKFQSIQERKEIDGRSIYVSNVDYSATPEELQQLFSECGTINRITILTNRLTGTPLGYGFIEFESAESIPKALENDQTLFKGRPIKVTPKRTNLPGFGSRGRCRGGFVGRGRGRGGFGGRGRGRGGPRGRGGFRGRGAPRGARGGFNPY